MPEFRNKFLFWLQVNKFMPKFASNFFIKQWAPFNDNVNLLTPHGKFETCSFCTVNPLHAII